MQHTLDALRYLVSRQDARHMALERRRTAEEDNQSEASAQGVAGRGSAEEEVV